MRLIIIYLLALLLTILAFGSMANSAVIPKKYVPQFRYQSDETLESRYYSIMKKYKPIPYVMPNYFKPPNTLSNSDDFNSMRNKWLLSQMDMYLNDFKTIAKASDNQILSNTVKTAEKVIEQSLNVNMTTKTAKHEVKCDIPRGLLSYNADWNSFNLAIKREFLIMKDEASVVKNLTDSKRVGVRYELPSKYQTVFFEQSF